MENTKMNDGSSIKFKVRNGFFVRRCTAVFLLLLFLACLLAVGLLVYFLAPRAPTSGAEEMLNGDSGLSPKSAKSKESVLLPRSLKPVYYDVQLQPFLPPEGNSTFAGSVLISARVNETTDTITMHANNISIHEQSVRVTVAGGTVDVDGVSWVKTKQFVIIKLRKSLNKGSVVNVSMDFIGHLNDDLAGFYRSSYLDERGNRSWLAVTQFQPTDARRAFPCFDEPEMKAKFEITLIRPSKLISLSNMPISHSVERDDGWVEDHYQTSVDMSTYLLAFVVCNFTFRSQNATNTQFRVWARPSAAGQIDYALNAGPKILNFYQQYFGTDFPLPKLDMIAVPDFKAGAMENWGLITYRETTVLWDPAISSSGHKERVVSVIAHELAHQWFGNLVTPKWWDDLWLNEGFATYMQNLGGNHVEPSFKMLDSMVGDLVIGVMDMDSLATSHPISIPVNDPDEINEIFDEISYEKGSSVIRMMQHFLGEDTFRKGLMSYLKEFSYKNADSDDLWRHLSQASIANNKNIDVKSVMDSWTKQTGYPVLKVERNYTSGTTVITQSRFLMVSTEEQQKQNSGRWHIPITYTTASRLDFSDTTPKLWFYKDNDSVTLPERVNVTPTTPDEWLILNIGMTSFYRTNYDERNWQLLTQQLLRNHTAIDSRNRIQIIDDAMNLARGGLLDYDISFNVTSYLKAETEFYPWMTGIKSITLLNTILQHTAAYGSWKAYIKQLITPIYDTLSFDESPSDPHTKKLLRPRVVDLACKMAEIADCLKRSAALYKQWMDFNDTDPIPPNIKGVVVCSAIKQGGEREWNFALQRYMSSNVGYEKEILLGAMTCTEKMWILGKYLAMSLDPNSVIRKQDAVSVFSRIAATPLGNRMAFDFLRDRWTEIKKQHGNGFTQLSSMVQSITLSFNTPYQLKQLKQFMDEHRGELGSATRSFDQAVEEVQANVNWMKNSYEKVAKWLEASHN